MHGWRRGRRGQRLADQFETECPVMANGNGLRMAVCADAGDAWKFGKLAPGLDKKHGSAAP
jgi:hypothetical protein